MYKDEIISLPFNGRMKDLTNQRFGKLTAIKYMGISKNRRAIWLCKCDCGKEDLFLSNSLLTGRTTSCGCYQKEIASANYVGKKFGKLTAIKRLDKVDRYTGSHYYLCQCECGNQCEVSGNSLINHNVSSCGCLRSRKEYEISELFKQQNIEFKTQYWFDDLKDQKPLRFDFAIFKNNQLSCLLEYQGQQHYNTNDNWYKESIALHDIMKIEYCKEKNIPLIIINKNNYNNLLKLIKEFI